MKIKQVKIYGFGKWTNQVFDFNQGVQVIYGLNEAGKSTLMQFIIGMLFGFTANKGKHVNTYEPQSKAEYGGELVFTAGDLEYRLIRVGRTATDTTMYYTKTNLDVPDAEGTLAEILAPLTRETFQQVYSFSQFDLNEITELNPTELNERLLRIGAAGSDQWLQVAQQFEKSAKNKFAANSKAGKRPINEMINNYRALQARLQAASATLPAYQALSRQIINVTQQNAAYGAGSKAKQARLLDLQALQRVAPIYREWQTLKMHTSQSVVPTNEISGAVQDKVASLQVQIKSAQTDLERLGSTEQNAQVQSPELAYYLENQPQLDQLELNLPRYEQLGTTYQRLTNEAQLAENQLAQLANQIGITPVPQPLTNAKLQQAQNRQQHHKIDVTLPVIIAVVGVLLMSLTSGFGRIVGIALMLIGIVFGIYKFKQSQANENVSQSVGKYFESKSVSEIYALQPLLLEHANQAQKLTNSRTQLTTMQGEVDGAVMQLNALARFTGQPASVQNLPVDVLRARQFLQLINQQRHGEAATSAKVEFNRNAQLEARRRYQELQAELQTVYLGLNVASDQAYQVRLDEQTEQQQQHVRMALLAAQLTTAQIEQLERLTDSQLQEQTIKAQQAVDDAENMQQSYQAQLANLNAKQQQMAQDGTYAQVQQQLANAQAELLQQLDNYYVEALAAQWINQALAAASSERLPQILTLATNYFKILTLSRYNEIRFVNNEIKLVTADGAEFVVEQLSTGTSEQLYVALRFAFAMVLQDIVAMPLLIDDGFVNFDYQRRQSVLDLLLQLGEKQQVLYFTADVTIRDTVPSEALITL